MEMEDTQSYPSSSARNNADQSLDCKELVHIKSVHLLVYGVERLETVVNIAGRLVA